VSEMSFNFFICYRIFFSSFIKWNS